MGKQNSSLVDKWLEDDNLFLIECWCREGYKNEDLANRMGINVTTLAAWKGSYKEISTAMSKGKELVDYRVENALLKSALGYIITETKSIINGKPDKEGNRTVRVEKTEREIAPNVTAIAMWLNNRRPDKWKRNRDNILELKDEDTNITVNIIKHSRKEDEESDEWSLQAGTKADAGSKDKAKSINAKEKEVIDSNKSSIKKEKVQSTKKGTNEVIEDDWDTVIAETSSWE